MTWFLVTLIATQTQLKKKEEEDEQQQQRRLWATPKTKGHGYAKIDPPGRPTVR